ncbi:MAG: hypothetical protein AAF511_05890 [Pseudomonadota bacterium]
MQTMTKTPRQQPNLDQDREQINSDYDRLFQNLLHYERLMYTSTAPILAILLPLAGVSLGAGNFEPLVRFTSAVSGAILSILAWTTAIRLTSNIYIISRYMRSIELETGIGHREKYKLDVTWVRKVTPNILRLRYLIFVIFIVFFVYVAFVAYGDADPLQYMPGQS